LKEFFGVRFFFCPVYVKCEDGCVSADAPRQSIPRSILCAARCRRGARFSVPPWPTDPLLLAATKVHATPVRSFNGKATAGWGYLGHVGTLDAIKPSCAGRRGDASMERARGVVQRLLPLIAIRPPSVDATLNPKVPSSWQYLCIC
jgi:hypothetical protein